MDYLLEAVALVVAAIGIHHLVTGGRKWKSHLPPGSLGVPVIGQTLSVLRALRANRLDRWIRDRIHRYGPVSKVSVLCTPTVIMAGPAANKFIFFSSALRTSTPRSFQRIFGEKTIMDVHGEDHRRIRGALMEFLKPDVLRLCVGRVDAMVRRHLERNWRGQGHAAVTVLPLVKRLTFDVISALLFGLETGAVQDDLADDFGRMAEGMYAVPVNLPFTAFGRSLEAGRRARRLIERITRDNKAKLAQGEALPANKDLIARLLSLRDDHGEQLLTTEEIVDNGLFALVVGHDTASVLITCMLWHLTNDPATLAAMAQEHEEIARNKAAGEALTWEDLSRMKFTWQVAQETLRIHPPTLGNTRTAFEDVHFDGYCIPKGWLVFWMAKLTHMDPNIFHEPAKFDPSRFGSMSSLTPPCSFVPFGGGPRICPGIEFTKIQTLVTMHNLVRNVRWKEATTERKPATLDGLQIEHFKLKLCCKDNTRSPLLEHD